MIAVVGSRYDPVSADLVSHWPGASLCAAEDLTARGWTWSPEDGEPRRWVIAGRPVDDSEVTGVFVRRFLVLPEELNGIHPDDRGFVASEAEALLALILATTHAHVVNSVVDGAFGAAAIAPARWIRAAAALDIATCPSRLWEPASRRPSPQVRWPVEVVGSATFGDGPRSVHDHAIAIAREMRIDWAVFGFDWRSRLLGVTAEPAPGPAARDALGRILSGRS